MKHGRPFLVCILSAMAVILAPVLLSAEEPIHKGKPLNEWVVLLKGDDLALRKEAAKAFAELGPKASDALPALLLTLVWEANEDVVTDVIEALGKIGQPAVAPLIKHRLRVKDYKFRARTRRVLTRIGKDVVPDLIEILQGPQLADEEGRLDLIEVLVKIGPDARPALPTLEALLSAPQDWVRLKAAEAIWKIDGKTDLILPVVEAELSGDSFNPRLAAASLLRMIDRPRAEAVALPILLKQLNDDYLHHRIRIAETLAAFGPQAEGVMPALIGLLGDSESFVRLKVAEILFQFGPEAKPAVPALIVLLKDEHNQVRAQAARTLGQIGPDAKDAAPALRAASGGDDERVCQAATEALHKITPDTLPHQQLWPYLILAAAATILIIAPFWIARRRRRASTNHSTPPPSASEALEPAICFRCPHCGGEMEFAKDAVGKEVRCPQCKGLSVVPTA